MRKFRDYFTDFQDVKEDGEEESKAWPYIVVKHPEIVLYHKEESV